MPGRVMFLLTHFCGGVVSVDPFEYGNDTSTDSRERQLLDLGLDPKEGGAAELSSEVRKAAEYKLNLFVGRFTFTIALHAWKNSHVDPWLTVKWLLPLIRKRTVWARLEEMAAVPFARSFVLLTYIATGEPHGMSTNIYTVMPSERLILSSQVAFACWLETHVQLLVFDDEVHRLYTSSPSNFFRPSQPEDAGQHACFDL
eukprot:s1472_g1.t2